MSADTNDETTIFSQSSPITTLRHGLIQRLRNSLSDLINEQIVILSRDKLSGRSVRKKAPKSTPNLDGNMTELVGYSYNLEQVLRRFGGRLGEPE